MSADAPPENRVNFGMTSRSPGYGATPELQFPWETRFGLRDIEVHTQPHLKSGTVMMYGMRYLWVGMEPLTEREEFMRQIRLGVRQGLKDAFDWLDIRVDVYPLGPEVMESLRLGSNEYVP